MPDPEALQVMAAMTAAGKSTRQIEAVTGYDHSTVARAIQSDEARQLINQGREEIAAHFTQRVLEYVASDAKIEGTQLMIQYGIALDKYDKTTQPNSDGIKITINIDNRSVNVEPGT